MIEQSSELIDLNSSFSLINSFNISFDSLLPLSVWFEGIERMGEAVDTLTSGLPIRLKGVKVVVGDDDG